MTGFVVGFNWFVLGYFIVLNTVQLTLIALAGIDIARSHRWSATMRDDEIFANPLTPGISIIVPAHNEAAGIAEAVRAMLTIRYPLHEVVVVDDGSTDDTFGVLSRTFNLVEVDLVFPNHVPVTGVVRSMWLAGTGEPLTVIRKENAQRRSDALNAGLNYARFDLVCMVDADSILEQDALLRVVRPFVDDPERVVGTGGVIRAANGARVDRGRIVNVRLPKRWIERVQVVEYLRSFLLGRTGWSRIGGLLIISGAFGLFRKDLVYAIGGLDRNTLAEDADLVAALHRHLRRTGQDHRIVFVPDPVCWTELPTTATMLSRQRRRWSHGLADLLWKFRAMIGNPRYGVLGVLTMPFYLAFEAFSPVVELLGLVAVVVALVLGILNWPFVGLLVLASVGYGVFLSLAAITVEELAFHRYARWRDLGALVAASIIENVGYRQAHSWWRLRGLLSALRGRPAVWGEMTRSGFETTDDATSRHVPLQISAS